MALYTYTFEKNGVQETRTMEAQDRYAVFQQVKSDGGKLITLAETHGSLWARVYTWFTSLISVGSHELAMLARTLSSMLAAGLSLTRALAIAIREAPNHSLKRVLGDVADQIKQGKTLHESLTRHTLFSPLFVAMVRAGEESGNLSKSLALIADQLERGYRLTQQIRGAMLYPVVVILAMIGVSYLMLTEIMPTMMQTFQEQNLSLPFATQVLVAASTFLTEYTLLTSLVLVITCVSVIGFAKTRFGTRFLHRVVVMLPVIGPLVVGVTSARAARTLSSLVSSGVDMVQALSITKDVVVNTCFKDVITAAEEAVVAGKPLSHSFTEKNTVFPLMFGEMIAVGEETGDMAGMLARLAQYFEEEVDQKMKNIVSLLEPILMLFIGGTVGFFALAIIAPIYTLSDSI